MIAAAIAEFFCSEKLPEEELYFKEEFLKCIFFFVTFTVAIVIVADKLSFATLHTFHKIS